MDEYDLIKKSSLKLKGDPKKKKTKKKKHAHSKCDKTDSLVSNNLSELAEDASNHGGWWKTTKYEQIRADVVIEFSPGCYAKALSNGRIVLGNPHPSGEAPCEEEIFTAVPAGTNLIAFKSGFDRYLSIDSLKRFVGISEAIGEAEKFVPVYEDGKAALCSVFNDCFLSVDENSQCHQIIAKSLKAGPSEMLNIRVNSDHLMLSIKNDLSRN
jgi:protein FRG1